jgi:ribosome-binding factor A
MAYKKDKVSVAILKHVSDILQFEVKSPEIGFVTVTGAEVTQDLSYAKIYISVFDRAHAEKRMEALNRVKGFVRSSLAKKLTIRKVPELIFVLDTSAERGEKIDKILKEIEQKEVQKES